MNKICRICLEEGVLSSIFTKNFNISLCDMIEYCSNVKISRNDGLPEQVCSNCIYKLGIAYHFKQTCEGADLRLKQYLGIIVPQKTAEVAVMTDPMVTHTIIKKCKCKLSEQKKSGSSYKRKAAGSQRKRGPKPQLRPPPACYHCHKQFRCQAQLDMHLRTHTGERPFACGVCSRRFAQKHNLTVHQRLHSGERPFQCHVCSKRFAAQGNLQAHIKIHTGQKDHVCSQCLAAFVTASELTRHSRRHRPPATAADPPQRPPRPHACPAPACRAAYVHKRDLKLHKLKKHQIAPQDEKLQPEGFAGVGTNVDIIGLDVEKEVPPVPAKVNHTIVHLVHKDPEPVAIPQHSHILMPYNHKEMKDVYSHQYGNKVLESQTCTICGEGFDYVTSLAQHYMDHHKDYEHNMKNYGLNLT